jgi:hypothetical protein
VRRLYYPNYAGPEWFIPKQKWDNPMDTFNIPTGMFKDQVPILYMERFRP